MFANRPLMFLGYSLQTDRTVEALLKIHDMLPGLAHFAILAAHYVPARLDARRAELDSCGIMPLWFLPGHFSAINDVLSRLLTAVSVRKIADSAAARQLPVASFRNWRRLLFIPTPKPKALLEEPPAIPDGQRSVIERIARSVHRGRVVLFLGSGAHLGNIVSGDEFYERIAERFNCAHLNWDRSAVARYIVDRYGSEALVEAARGLLSVDRIPVSAVYEFVAWLASRKGRPLTLFTTNQDGMIERVLTEAGLGFHEFKYIGAGPTEGLFAWRRPDGRIDLVERPENVDSVGSPGETVLVKLNGGFSADPMMPESLLLARGDFERLAGRIPEALPSVLRAAIRDCSLLFLGHGLNEPDVEALIRYSSPNGVLKSWAVHRPGEMAERIDYWENCGLELISSDLGGFVRHLYRAIASLGGGAQQTSTAASAS